MYWVVRRDCQFGLIGMLYNCSHFRFWRNVRGTPRNVRGALVFSLILLYRDKYNYSNKRSSFKLRVRMIFLVFICLKHYSSCSFFYCFMISSLLSNLLNLFLCLLNNDTRTVFKHILIFLKLLHHFTIIK